MNLRRAMRQFKSFYGGKKKARRVELPEERDVKALRSEARQGGFKNVSDYLLYKKKNKKKDRFNSRPDRFAPENRPPSRWE